MADIGRNTISDFEKESSACQTTLSCKLVLISLEETPSTFANPHQKSSRKGYGLRLAANHRV